MYKMTLKSLPVVADGAGTPSHNIQILPKAREGSGKLFVLFMYLEPILTYSHVAHVHFNT